jgi:hypothetical protein
MKDAFWKRFSNSQDGHRSYSVGGIERTLETVGVECNTHVSDLVKDTITRPHHLLSERYLPGGRQTSFHWPLDPAPKWLLSVEGGAYDPVDSQSSQADVCRRTKRQRTVHRMGLEKSS